MNLKVCVIKCHLFRLLRLFFTVLINIKSIDSILIDVIRVYCTYFDSIQT